MKYPHYKDYRTRLESFKEWPLQLKQRPADLAAAGFYYLGSCDCVWCFFCGGCLGRWEEEDDLWKEHTRWYPDCDFLKLCEREVTVTGIKVKSEKTMDIEQRHPDKEISGSASSSISEAIQVASRDPMDCPEAQRVLAMGYHSEMIVQAMQIFANRKWHFNFSVADLLNIIFENENAEIKSKKKPDFRNVAAHTPTRLGNITGTNREEQSGNTSCSLEDSNRGDELNKTIPPQDSISTPLNLQCEIRNQMTCTICKNCVACIVFLSCCNILACPECAPALRKCSACKQLTKGTVRAYIS